MAGGQMLWRRRAGPTITMAWIRTNAVRMVTAALKIVAGAEVIYPPRKSPAPQWRGPSLADSLVRGGGVSRVAKELPNSVAMPGFKRGGGTRPIPLNTPANLQRGLHDRHSRHHRPRNPGFARQPYRGSGCAVGGWQLR